MDLDDDFDADDVVDLQDVEKEIEGDLTMSELLESDEDESKGSVPPDDNEDVVDSEEDDKPKIPKEMLKSMNDSDDELDEQEETNKKRYRKQFNFITNVKKDEIRNSEEFHEEHGEQQFEPFNLKQERADGFYDQFGTFHANAKEEEDPYLDIMDEDRAKPVEEREMRMRKSTISKHKSHYEDVEKALNSQEMPDLFRALNTLIPLLNEEENVESAIKRYGAIVAKGTAQNKQGKRKANPQWTSGPPKKKRKKKKRRSWEVPSDEEDEETQEEVNQPEEINKFDLEAARKKIEILTENATNLYAADSRQFSEIYKIPRSKMIAFVRDHDRRLVEMRRREAQQRDVERLNHQRRSDSKEMEDAEMVSVPVEKYEYKWDDDKEEQIHGPYILAQFQRWQELGHFKDRTIHMRKCGADEWLHILHFDIDTFRKLS